MSDNANGNVDSDMNKCGNGWLCSNCVTVWQQVLVLSGKLTVLTGSVKVYTLKYQLLYARIM